MPTRRWIPTEGCHCWRCRRARWSVNLHPLLITLAIGLTPLVVLFFWLD